jgi:phosphoglycolate phosphatase
LGPLELDELVQTFRKNLLLEIKKGNRIFDGVLPFIQKSKNLGISIGVATTKPTYLAKEVIDNSELAKLIDFIQGTDGFSPKPDPEVLRRCMQGLGIENAVMFGDRIEDIQAAKTLGIPSIGIAQSAHSIQDLLGEGATYSFSNFTELGLNFDLIIQLIKKV